MNKAKYLFASMMAFMCLVSLPSCSDDNDDKPASPAAKLIEGSYKGDMECSVMGSASTFEDMTFTVTSTDDATVSVALPAFGEAPMAMPSITVEGVKVNENNGSVTLSTTEVNGTTPAGKRYTCTLTGSVENKVLNVKFNLRYGAMPMPMICTSAAQQQ